MAKKTDDAALEKAFDGVIFTDLEFKDTGPTVIPTGFSVLDFTILKRGGIPIGKITEANGEPGTCKSILGYQIMASAQKLFPDRYVVLVDTEFVIRSKEDLEWLQMHGVDTSKERFKLIQENSAEDVYNAIMDIADDPKCSLIVLDSIGNMDVDQNMTGKRFEREKGKVKSDQPGVFAKVTQAAMKRLVRSLAHHRTTMFIINQKRDQLNAYAGAPASPGGNNYRHNRSVVLELRNVEKLERNDEIIGQVVKCKVSRSKVSAAGETDANTHLNFFFTGQDERVIFELYNAAVELGIIVKAGSWLKWGDKRWQGSERVFRELEDNEELRTELQSEIEKKR